MSVQSWGDIDATIRRLIANRASASQAIAEVSELFDDGVRLVSGLDLVADLASLTSWLETLLATEAPDESIFALMFGMADLEDPQSGKAVATLYLCGSDTFDPDDDACDWAADPAYFPESRYANSEVLARLAELGSGRLASEFLTASYAVAAVREICDRLGPSAVLACPGGRMCDARAVAVGHDAGGAWTLGVVTSGGWLSVAEFTEGGPDRLGTRP